LGVKKPFFKNIGSIICYAIFGTLIAIVSTALMMYAITLTDLSAKYTMLECFSFSALISATDPVSVLATFKEVSANKELYSLIFGESTLNDGLTLTFYRALVGIKELKNHSSAG
jgi:NhaP-type Na+/H+ or K+/H+ antiporter